MSPLVHDPLPGPLAVAPAPTVVQSTKTTGLATPETFAFAAVPTDGNLLLLHLSSVGGQPLTAPPGFTLYYNQHTIQNSLLYGKIAAGESNSYQWTYAAAQKYAVLGVEIAGMDPGALPPVGEANGGTGTALASTPLTPTVLNCLPLAFGANQANAATTGVSPGWTQLQSTPTTNIAAFLYGGTPTTDLVTPTSIAWTWAVTTTWWTMISVLLAPMQLTSGGDTPQGPYQGPLGGGSPGGLDAWYPGARGDALRAVFTQPRRGGT